MKISLYAGLLFTVVARVSFGQATIGNCPVFPANNIWNTPIDKLPVAANSGTLVNTIGASKYFHPDFGSGTYQGSLMGIPVNLVPGTQTKYPAKLVYADESDAGPYAIPLNAQIEGGSDRHVISVDVDNCILYELFAASPGISSWSASGGAIFNLKSNALRPYGWTSTDAAGLPIMAGLIKYDEVASGEIKHAIRFTAPQTRRAFVWPARHYASTLTGTQYPRMGERFRLKANFDITPFPPEVQVILKAMKKYGIILADNGSSWFLTGQPDPRWNNTNLLKLHNLTGSAFEAVDTTSLMIDIDSGEARQSGVSVSVSPSNPTLYVGRNQQFTAAVTGSSNTAVTWSVDGIAGGNAARGFISASGLYMAPTALPAPPTVLIKATSAASPTTSATSSVTVTSLPNIASLSPNPIVTASYTLTVNGVGFRSGAVIKVSGASVPTTWVSSTQVRGTGVFSASKSAVPVMVTNPDGVSSNTVNVSVKLPVPAPAPPATGVTISISPATLTIKVLGVKQYTATVAGTANKAVVWRVNGVVGGNKYVGTISATGLYTAPRWVSSAGLKTEVSATSAANTSKIARAAVFITP